MSKFRVSNADTFHGNVRRSRDLSDRTRLGGHYDIISYGPVLVADPQMLFDITKVETDEKGLISKKIADFLSKQYPVLEKLFSGGNQKWHDDFHNIVVNEGLDHILDVVLAAGTQDTTWFVGLLAASPTPGATWTATEIAANDFVNYDESTLQAFTPGAVSGQSVDNSASKASFTISADSSSIGGAFLIGTNTKATPAGTLYSAGAFSGGNKAADDGDTLEVTATFTSADDGV